MQDVTLNPADAAELAEILGLIGQWLASDPHRLQASLGQFIGHPAYTTQHLHADLDRFIFLLGGSDGEELFALDDDQPLQ